MNLTNDDRKTRTFCKQFKPRGQREAYNTVEAPQAMQDWLRDHHFELGKCTRRNTGPVFRMRVALSSKPPEPQTRAVCVDLGDEYGLQTLVGKSQFVLFGSVLVRVLNQSKHALYHLVVLSAHNEASVDA